MAMQLFEPAHLVKVADNQLITTSLLVAEAFGKQHKDVLRRIRELDCTPEFASAHFCAHVERVAIGNGATRDSKVVQMTKDGFIFLVMGFTGAQAARVKEAYINAFNRMAELLASAPATAPQPAEITISQDEYIELLKAKIALLEGPARESRPPVEPITDEEKAHMYQLADLGLGHREIARRTGRSAAAVSYIVRAYKEQQS